MWHYNCVWSLKGYARKLTRVVHYLYGGATEDVGAVNVDRLRSLQAALYGVLVAVLRRLEENALLRVDVMPSLERMERWQGPRPADRLHLKRSLCRGRPASGTVRRQRRRRLRRRSQHLWRRRLASRRRDRMTLMMMMVLTLLLLLLTWLVARQRRTAVDFMRTHPTLSSFCKRRNNLFGCSFL